MTAGAPTIGGLKRLRTYMAGQLASAVAITGGTISGVTMSNNTSVNSPVAVTSSTVTITQAANAGRTTYLNRAAGITATLPAATGTGATYTFVIGATVTTPSTIIKVANSSDAFIGFSQVVSDNSAAVLGYIAAANTDDTITLNGTTTGGYAGDIITIRDVDVNVFQVEVRGKATGTEATPFSATV